MINYLYLKLNILKFFFLLIKNKFKYKRKIYNNIIFILITFLIYVINLYLILKSK